MNNLLKITLISFLLSFPTLLFSQAKKPTLMIVPSDAWCIENGYYLEIDNQGRTQKVPDYKMAFQESTDLNNVISKINGIMAERGFPLKNMESVIKRIESNSIENSLISSKTGASVEESSLDFYKKRAKADIILQLSWVMNENGPKKSVTFNLQGIDSYSNKQIATAQGTGAPSFSTSLVILLEEAVLAHMDNFTSTLQSHFDDLFANGREIVIVVKVFSNSMHDLGSEVGGEELGYVIEDWLADNTVQGRFSTTDATATFMFFEQVRIPLYNERKRAIDARRFTRGLQKHLADNYQITAKVATKGLGEATLILGDK